MVRFVWGGAVNANPLGDQSMRLSNLTRFSLRSLLLVTVLFSGCLAWFTHRAHMNRRQREAVHRIWKMGGLVAFKSEPTYTIPLNDNEWLAETSKTWFDDVLRVRTPEYVLFASMRGKRSDVDDDDIEELIDVLKQLPSIRYVRLDATDITEEGVARMQAALPDCMIRRPTIPPRRQPQT